MRVFWHLLDFESKVLFAWIAFCCLLTGIEAICEKRAISQLEKPPQKALDSRGISVV